MFLAFFLAFFLVFLPHKGGFYASFHVITLSNPVNFHLQLFSFLFRQNHQRSQSLVLLQKTLVQTKSSQEMSNGRAKHYLLS